MNLCRLQASGSTYAPRQLHIIFVILFCFIMVCVMYLNVNHRVGPGVNPVSLILDRLYNRFVKLNFKTVSWFLM